MTKLGRRGFILGGAVGLSAMWHSGRSMRLRGRPLDSSRSLGQSTWRSYPTAQANYSAKRFSNAWIVGRQWPSDIRSV